MNTTTTAKQQGFTLVELVVVIVILGILAATAIPKFVDLSSDAGTATVKGVAGALASGSATNYAAKLVGNGSAQTLNGNNATTCTTAVLQPLVTGITLTDGTGATANGNTYNVSAGVANTTTCASSPGVATGCVLQGFKGTSFEATIICTGP